MDWAHKYTDKQIAKIEKQLKKEYARASKEVEQKLFSHLSRYEKKDVKMRQKVLDGKITEQRYKTWRKGQFMTGRRWEAMRNTLATDLHMSNVNARVVAESYMPKVFAENYNWSTFVAEKQIGMQTSFTLFDENTVRKLASENPNLLPKSKLNAAKDVLWNERKISSEMTQGIMQGESIPKISKRLQRVTGMNETASMRTARTLMTRAQNAGRMESMIDFAKMGIIMYKTWFSAGDDRVRPSHRNVDGECVRYDEYFSNGMIMPADPDGSPEEVWNCRCDMLTSEQRDFYAEMIRDPEARNMKMDELLDNEDAYMAWKEGR